MELSKKIYQLRKLAGMTQEQLAEKLNISRQTLSKWENGTSISDVERRVSAWAYREYGNGLSGQLWGKMYLYRIGTQP